MWRLDRLFFYLCSISCRRILSCFSRALLSLHVFIGCDSVHCFKRKEKIKPFELMKEIVRITSVTPGIVHMFIKSCLLLAFVIMWLLLRCLWKIRIIKCYSIIIWNILSPQIMNNICKVQIT